MVVIAESDAGASLRFTSAVLPVTRPGWGDKS